MQGQISKGSFSVCEFLASWRDVIAMFAPARELDMMAESLGSRSEPDENVLKTLVVSSSICRILFKQAALKSGYNSWIKRIKSDLDALVHNDMNEDDIANFRTVHKHEAASLENAGIDAFEVLNMELAFLTSIMEHKRRALSDEWRLPLVALLTTIVVSNGQVDRFAWERMAWGDSVVVEAMTTLRAPAWFVNKTQPLRRQVNRILEGVDSLSQMKKVLQPHVNNLLEAHPDFELDLKWLNDHSGPVVREMAHGMMLDCMTGFPHNNDSNPAVARNTPATCVAQLQAYTRTYLMCVSF